MPPKGDNSFESFVRDTLTRIEDKFDRYEEAIFGKGEEPGLRLDVSSLKEWRARQGNWFKWVVVPVVGTVSVAVFWQGVKIAKALDKVDQQPVQKADK